MKAKGKRQKDEVGAPFRARSSLLAFLAALLLLLMTGAKPESPPVTIRVKLCTLGRQVELVGDNMTWKAEANSGKSNRIRLGKSGGKITVNGQKISSALVSITASGAVAVDGHPYHGAFTAVSDGAGALVNNLDLETYVTGVINQEMDSRWKEAAVDAQAIIARTYALKMARARSGQRWDLDRTVEDQVYGGIPAEDKLAKAAVERTRGKALTYNGELILPNYHACCGGHTELPSAVWDGPDLPWQQSVACTHCQNSPRFFWRFPERGAVSAAELAGLLGMKRGTVSDVAITERTATGRVKTVSITASTGKYVLSGFDFRKQIGYDRLFSTAFEVEREKSGFIFRGSGSGHGAGLCQYGAKGMAEKGHNASAILGFYYPGTKVERYR